MAAVASQPPRSSAPDADLLAARALQLWDWARRHTRWLLLAAAVLVVAVAVGLYAVWSRRQRAERAAAELWRVQQSLAVGNPTVAARELESFVQRFDGTPAAAQARVLLGRSYLELGQPARAIAALRPVTKDLDSAMGPGAALLLGDAYQAAGQVDAAVRQYLRVADHARLAFDRRQALQKAGAVLMERDPARAAEIYTRLVRDSEAGSLERALFEMRAAEAAARAQAARR
jgi:predicted negative regulator of RcsB-dependent stress response